MSPGSPAVWRVLVRVPGGTAAAFAGAIECHCAAVSWTVPEGDGEARVEGYAETEPDRAVLVRLLGEVAVASRSPAPHLEVDRLQGRDWQAESLRRLPPVAVGRYFVHGSHVRAAPPAGSIHFRVDAATAFGSGEHGTTRGCLVALDALARRLPVRSALDLGCGSGILALAVAKAWRAPVVAVDVDAGAVRLTGENARRNGVRDLVRPVESDGYRSSAVRRAAPYDLIVANILAQPLRHMAAGLGRHLGRRGCAVLSGLLEGDRSGVLSAHRAQGLALLRYVEVDGWWTLVIGRRP